jgi:GNAT superfamily N-acetyltransferase
MTRASMPPELQIRPTSEADRQWIAAFTADHWGTDFVVAHGVVYHPHRLPGFVAHAAAGVLGLATYSIDRQACELVTLNTVTQAQGIGTALLQAVAAAAKQAGCARLWLITTNDNLDALAFYQKRGMHLVALHPNALALSRQLKPSIPLVAANGIPIRDELELELLLAP